MDYKRLLDFQQSQDTINYLVSLIFQEFLTVSYFKADPDNYLSNSNCEYDGFKLNFTHIDIRYKYHSKSTVTNRILTIPTRMIVYEEIDEMKTNARKYFMKMALTNLTSNGDNQ